MDRKINSAFLAHAFGVRPNTISEWVKRGMPVLKAGGGRGLENEFHFPHVIRWVDAKARLDARRMSLLETIPMVLLGDALGAGDGTKTDFAKWRPWAISIAKELGGTERDFDGAITELMQKGLLDGAFYIDGATDRGRIS